MICKYEYDSLPGIDFYEGDIFEMLNKQGKTVYRIIIKIENEQVIYSFLHWQGELQHSVPAMRHILFRNKAKKVVVS